MTIPEITNTIKALRRESQQIKSEDTDSAEKVEDLIEKLEQQLVTPTIDNHESLIDHLKHSIGMFESQHPRITAIANDLMVKLAGLGV